MPPELGILSLGDRQRDQRSGRAHRPADGMAEVSVKLLAAVRELGLDRVLAQVDWGGRPAAQVEDSVARYATEIGPALRAA